ncbi:MAG TPA: DUF4445 domain-containing protein [Thermotogaceae bacterium]|nr:DUF4445 domain-containing protein [Thermotogaceae bacterium]
MNNYTITIVNYKIDITSPSKVSLLNILNRSGMNIPSYCAGRGVCGKCKVRFIDPIPTPTKAEEKLLSNKEIQNGIRLACQHFVNSNISLELSEKFDFDIFIKVNQNHRRKSNTLGIAVDLGTTTIYMRAIDLESRDWLFEAMSLNPLIMFGADVVSRMTWIIEKNKGAFFSRQLFGKISSILVSGISKLNYRPQIRKMVIVGNNPMMHLLLNLDISKLAFAPYESPYLHKPTRFDSKKYGFDENFEIFIPPSIGGFIGSDFSAVLYFLEDSLFHKRGAVIDLGTNGEMGIWNKNGVFVTSTAAGPAFEGMKIAHGMVAIDGAIESFKINNTFHIKTVGNTKPKGICGSGLIDILSEFLKNNFIHKNGRINSKFSDENDRILIFDDPTDPIYLYQKDIREIQLSKAAISAALRVLSEESGITLDNIEDFFLAGNFGNTMNIENAVTVGLLPKIKKERFKLIGNAALKGAVKFCLDERSGIDFLKNIDERLKHVRLENDEKFIETFVEMMKF